MNGMGDFNPPYWYKNNCPISIDSQFKFETVSVIIMADKDIKE